jgi:hypothetical protein
MICPKWVGVLAQPIAVEDLMSYLLEALELPGQESQVFEIGGPDQVGAMATGCGDCAAFSTCSSAASAFGAADATRGIFA